MLQDLSKLSKEDKLAVRKVSRVEISLCVLACIYVLGHLHNLFVCLFVCLFVVFQLLERDSPELFDLLDDFDSRFSEAIHMLHPLVSVARDTSTITPKVQDCTNTM